MEREDGKKLDLRGSEKGKWKEKTEGKNEEAIPLLLFFPSKKQIQREESGFKRKLSKEVASE